MNFRRHRWMGIPIFLAVLGAAAAIVMVLWNWLIPGIIGWSAIGYWQAAGLLVLCKMLFGSFRKGGGMHRDEGPFRRPDPRMGFMDEERNKIHEKVKNMSVEERREYIRTHMFGGRPGGHWAKHHGDQ